MEFTGLLNMPLGTLVVLGAALLLSFLFEAVNGFHDAANAVATIIYTYSLKPRHAIILSGICNFAGVYLGGVGVAFVIVHLLPIDLLVNFESGYGTIMIFAILISAIMWNLGTWYLGLPASSSHTMIGAIVGVGLANALIRDQSVSQGLYLGSFKTVFLSLLISPFLGFVLAGVLLLLLVKWIPQPGPYESSSKPKPSIWIRPALVFTSVGVSLAHGSNDGQKGVGLIMIILIGILPAQFALNPDYDMKQAEKVVRSLDLVAQAIDNEEDRLVGLTIENDINPIYRIGSERPHKKSYPLSGELEGISNFIREHNSFSTMDATERLQFRKRILMLEDQIRILEASNDWRQNENRKQAMPNVRQQLRSIIDYAPSWVILFVATAIGCGTMIGWKRVVVTVGEKIGKGPLTYAQGVSSQFVAALTIGVGAWSGLPVSTTQVLSSGVAGTMVASRVGVNYDTVKDIALAWLLTFPASILIAGLLFAIFYYLEKLIC